MPRALCLIRRALHYRRDCFEAGLAAVGFELVDQIRKPEAADLLVIWNRYSSFNEEADRFERHGARVLVAENCPFGNELRDGSMSLALRHVALTGGSWPAGGPERWDSWGVELQPFRAGGEETVILAQRGIGHPDVASPVGWADMARRAVGGRIRLHPATAGYVVPLAGDLERASSVVTWSSAAALQALVLGVPAWHAHPKFVGAGAARPLAEFGGEPKRDEAARLAMFRDLAWAIWRLEEIRTGEPFRRLLA